jgi:hypothetical protein
MSGAYIGVDDKARKIKGGYIGIDGKARKIKKGYIGDANGVARLCYSTGKKLSEYTVGSTVYLNENGTPVEFYVACHNYESGLNGKGRTLLVRKYCLSKMKWNSANNNIYSTSSVDDWLTTTYKERLDSRIQNIIGETSIYSLQNGSLATLKRSVFLLSVGELDGSNSVKEGTTLPNVTAIKQTDKNQWTRTQYSNYNEVYYLSTNGIFYTTFCTESSYVRPAFTVPDTEIVNSDLVLC